MATYVIGDVQGCFDQLQQLLQLVAFEPAADQLWFCGDLIARGPKSLETLRFVKSLGGAAVTVLGNHDLNFLAYQFGYGRIRADDQLDQLLAAPDLAELSQWLIQQPIIYVSEQHQALMVHAGLAPEWDIKTALAAAKAVSNQLQHDPETLFSQMYGNGPSLWQNAHTAAERHRFTINACTRMRFCDGSGALNLKEKSVLPTQPDLLPWFEFWRQKDRPTVFFGHWAALMGQSPISGIEALDTGCVWGNQLTCYCIESQQRYSVLGYQKRL